MQFHKYVTAKLEAIKDKKIFFEPLGGNNGDKLIEMGTMAVFERLQINLVASLSEAEVIIINGSGDLSYHSSDKPIEATRQVSIMLRFPEKPVILLPSSCTPGNAQNLQTALTQRRATTTLFARDAISFSLFKKLEDARIQVQLDDDMAFGLAGTKWLESLSSIPVHQTLLIVERFDAEGATQPPLAYKAPEGLRALIPENIKRWVKKNLLHSIHMNTPFVETSKQKVKELFPNVKYTTLKAADVSLPQNHSFTEFCEEIASSSIVVSTRLHACVLASLTGRHFIAVQFEGGNKVSGVFEQSLASNPLGKLWIKKKTD